MQKNHRFESVLGSLCRWQRLHRRRAQLHERKHAREPVLRVQRHCEERHAYVVDWTWTADYTGSAAHDGNRVSITNQPNSEKDNYFLIAVHAVFVMRKSHGLERKKAFFTKIVTVLLNIRLWTYVCDLEIGCVPKVVVLSFPYWFWLPCVNYSVGSIY